MIRTLYLIVATALIAVAAFGQPSSEVTIHFSPQQTCLVGALDVPCSLIGPKLLDQGTPRGVLVRLIGRSDTRYETVAAAMTSLQDSGFKLKVGHITYAGHAQ
jgi:hypothetical protein